MKKLAMLLVLSLGLFFLSGCCCHSTLVETAGERQSRLALQYDLQCKMVIEDWDYLWLQERTTYLTQWHPYVGIY
jgi:hypothetical protein